MFSFLETLRMQENPKYGKLVRAPREISGPVKIFSDPAAKEDPIKIFPNRKNDSQFQSYLGFGYLKIDK